MKHDIQTILLDCDGVLTDGKQYIAHDGSKMFKAFHSRDVRALQELVARGYRVIIVTADDSEITQQFVKRRRCEMIVVRDKSTLPFNDYGNFIAVGDDAWDVKMLQRAMLAFAPSDCDDCVLTVPNIQQLKTKGGDGVVAELARLLLNEQTI